MSTAGVNRRQWTWWLGLAVLIACGTAYFVLVDSTSLARLAEHEQALRTYHREHPVPVIVAAFATYVLATALSLPIATPMTVVYGWLFGFWQALALVSIAATAGSSVAFLFSRYCFRGFVQTRFGPQLSRCNSALERDGAFYLFTLRLIPIFPFWVVNLVMGVTPLPLRTFWTVSLLGMLPVKAVYAFAGSAFSLRELAEKGARGIVKPELLLALTLLGLFPWVAKKLLERFLQPSTK